MRTTTTNTWRSLEQDTEHAKEHSMRTLEEVIEDRHWFETALVTQPDLSAEQSANAQFVLGSMSYEGIGGPKDHAEAVRLFGLAAKQGHAYAQNSLGLMLREGEQVDLKTIQRQGGYLGSQPRKATPWHSLCSVSCTGKGRAARKTLLKRGGC